MSEGMTIGVDCTFSQNGRIRLRRLDLGDGWIPAEQGRQWQDENGKHVLVIVNGRAREIVLRPDTLNWELAPSRRDTAVV